MDDLRVSDEQLHDKGRTGKAYNGDQHAVSGLDAQDVYKRQGLVKESVRGDDIFIVVDPGNYSVTYKLFNYCLLYTSRCV